jgi:hypothetical protein
MAHDVRTGAALTSGVIVATGTGTAARPSRRRSPRYVRCTRQETDARDRLNGVNALKRLLGTSVASVLTAGVAVGLAVSGAGAAATPGWRVVTTYPQVQAMTAVSASDAANGWAVGLSGGCCDLFVSHWNGRKWETIAAPGGIGGGFTNQVTGASVAAIPGGRAMIFVDSTDEELSSSWVGAFEWRGRSWSAVHTFADLPGGAIASGPGDVWGFDSGTPSAEHYDGTSWSQVSIPVIVAQASGNAAAGDWVTGTVAAQPTRVELLHWGKGAWRNAVLPKIAVPAGDQMFPGAVDAATSANIWVTVSVGPSARRGPVTAVLLHWNGKAWSRVAVPKGVSPGSLASDGHGGAWLTSDQSALVMYHYSGGRWTHVPGPARTALQSDLEPVPGTRSVLAAGELSGSEGVALKYGP